MYATLLDLSRPAAALTRSRASECLEFARDRPVAHVRARETSVAGTAKFSLKWRGFYGEGSDGWSCPGPFGEAAGRGLDPGNGMMTAKSEKGRSSAV